MRRRSPSTAHDHVFVLSRPRTRRRGEQGATRRRRCWSSTRTASSCSAWGGPGSGYDWPDSRARHLRRLQGQRLDRRQQPDRAAALTTRSDDMLLKFTKRGEVRDADRRPRHEQAATRTRRTSRSRPTSFVYPKTNEAFVADGYGNRRVIVFDADTGAFKRMWGAFGNMPLDRRRPHRRPPGAARPRRAPALDTEGRGPQQFGAGARRQGLERRPGLRRRPPQRRVQVFTLDGKYVDQVFINRGGPSAQSAAGVGLLARSRSSSSCTSPTTATRTSSIVRPQDAGGARSVRRAGQPQPGDFQGIHHLAVDSKGNIYTAEVAPGRRFQRFVFKGKS